MSFARRAIKGFIVIFIVNIVSAFLGYLIRIVLARNLSVEDYGLFFALFTLISFVAIFNSLGLGDALVKFIPEFLVKKKPVLIKNSLLIVFLTQVVSIFLIAVIFFLSADFLASHYFKVPLARLALLLFIPALFFSNIKGVIRSVYLGFQRITFFAGIYFFENLGILFFLLLFFVFDKSVYSAIFAYTLVYFLIVIVFGPLLRKTFDYLKYKSVISKDLVKKLFGFGLPIMIAGVGGTIILYTDTLILTYFKGLFEVGIYNVAVPTAMMLLLFGRSIGSVMLPMVSELWARGQRVLVVRGLRLLELLCFVVLVPCAIIVLFLSRFILRVFFGAEYVAGTLTMQVLVIGMIPLVIYTIHATFFSAIGKPGIATKILFKGALINLLLNFIAIPLLGMLGAAITSLVTYVYIAFDSRFRIRKELIPDASGVS